jgi:hypothetical protein
LKIIKDNKKRAARRWLVVTANTPSGAIVKAQLRTLAENTHCKKCCPSEDKDQAKAAREERKKIQNQE